MLAFVNRSRLQGMYRLLIVDDEPNIRDGLANAVQWDTIGVEVVAQASDGVEALVLAEQCKPDIVITDISMAVMNGLDFMERVKPMSPRMRFVVLSGYGEFEYARRALDLDVDAYLLKPARPSELLVVIGKIVDDLDRISQDSRRLEALETQVRLNAGVLRERFLRDLVYGRVSEEEGNRRAQILGFEWSGGPYEVWSAAFDRDRGGESEAVDSHAADLRAQFVLEALPVLAGTNGHISGFVEANELVFVCSGGRLDPDRLTASLNLQFKPQLSWGIGGKHASLTGVAESRREASSALAFRSASGGGAVIRYSDLEGMGWTREESSELGIALVSAIEREEREGVSHLIAQCARLDASEVETLRDRIAAAVVARGGEAKDLSWRQDVPTLESLREYADTALDFVQQRRALVVKAVIRKAQVLMAEHFPDAGFGLQVLADKLDLNPTYFSSLYRQQTGRRYSEDLAKLRVDRAKSLLSETNLRTSDVGTAVGYPNPQYFATMFRRHTGKSPSEYREHS